MSTELWNVYAEIDEKRRITGYRAEPSDKKINPKKLTVEKSDLTKEVAIKLAANKTDVLDHYFDTR